MKIGLSLPARSAASMLQPGPAPRARAAAGASVSCPAQNPTPGIFPATFQPPLVLPVMALLRPSLLWEGFKPWGHPVSHTATTRQAGERVALLAEGSEMRQTKPPSSCHLARCPRHRLQQLRAQRGCLGSAPLRRPTPRKTHLAQKPTMMLLLPPIFKPGSKKRKSEEVKPGNKPHSPQPTSASLRKCIIISSTL